MYGRLLISFWDSEEPSRIPEFRQTASLFQKYLFWPFAFRSTSFKFDLFLTAHFTPSDVSDGVFSALLLRFASL